MLLKGLETNSRGHFLTQLFVREMRYVQAKTKLLVIILAIILSLG